MTNEYLTLHVHFVNNWTIYIYGVTPKELKEFRARMLLGRVFHMSLRSAASEWIVNPKNITFVDIIKEDENA